MPYFSLWELKLYEMKVAEEYQWAITEATGPLYCRFQLEYLV